MNVHLFNVQERTSILPEDVPFFEMVDFFLFGTLILPFDDWKREPFQCLRNMGPLWICPTSGQGFWGRSIILIQIQWISGVEPRSSSLTRIALPVVKDALASHSCQELRHGGFCIQFWISEGRTHNI